MSHSMRLTIDTDSGEFVGVYKRDGKIDESKSYYTDDKTDCIETIWTTFEKLVLCEWLNDLWISSDIDYAVDRELLKEGSPVHTVRDGHFIIDTVCQPDDHEHTFGNSQ